jgi:hypothetical protein
MPEIAFITIVGQVAIPLAFIIWLWRCRGHDRIEWLLRSLAAGTYFALIAVVGVWLLIPWYLAYAYAAGGLGAAAVSWRRANRQLPGNKRWPKSGFRRVSVMLLAVFCMSMLGYGFRGYSPPVGPIARLSAPLKNGTFYIANGGYSILINPHMKTLSHTKLAEYRGQSYALDIVKLDGFGLRAQGLWPEGLTHYHIYGEPVHAPCEGVVARIEKRLPDLKPLDQDRQNLAGNFVLLHCGETEVLLAHLMQESITVNCGERVRNGQVVGRVGNSGYSTEPHLHIHAQTRSPLERYLDAEPLPLQIEGRTPVRNSRVVSW